MFSTKGIQKITYFGGWEVEAGHEQYTREALEFCCMAVERCRDEDMRESQDVQASIDYLESIMARKTIAARFRKALHVENPNDRQRESLAAYKALLRAVTG